MVTSTQTIEMAGIAAKDAGITLSAKSEADRNRALRAVADALDQNRQKIIEANEQDIERGKAENLSDPLLKRLRFGDDKIKDVIKGIDDLIKLPDPLGKTLKASELDEGLNLYQVTTAIGVIGVIFESRPDAFVQISTLCLKSGNAVMLKGGKEALLTNRVLFEIIHDAARDAGMPEGWIYNLESRENVNAILALDEYIDLLIPRGSNAFVRYIMEHTKIPVMGHADGICHVYIDEDADPEKALAIAVDAKTQYVSVCNAMETLLIHEKIAPSVLPALSEAFAKAQVKLIGDEKVRTIITAQAATEDDWKTEYLDYVLSVKIVDSLDDAIAHINRYGSGHTDTIVTENKANAARFCSLVDSADVFVNCSTRFADGYRFGFGAEVGISTSKLHARGPVGLDGLVSTKYILIGDGQIVADYADGKKQFTHRPIDKQYPLS